MELGFKHPLLFGLLLILSLTVVSADCDWATHGNIFSAGWNEQVSPAQCYGRFDVGILNLTTTNGMTIISNMGQEQLLVSNLGSATIGDQSNKLIIINQNVLQVLDSSLNVESEKTVSGTPQGQFTTLTFGSNQSNNIAFISEINSTLHQLQIYTYNPSSHFLNWTFVYNFTSSINPNFSGLKGVGDRIFFLEQDNATSSQFLVFNNSGLQSNVSVNSYIHPVSPLGNWDMDNDGIIEYMGYDANGFVVFKSTGDVILTKTISVVNNQVTMAKIFPICFKQWFDLFTSCSVEWSIAVMDSGLSDAHIGAYRLNGNSIWQTSITSGGLGNKGTFAVQDDYNGDGYADIYSAVVQPSTSKHFFNIFSGRDGSSIYGNLITFIYSGENTIENFLSLADMNHNGKYDFIYTNYNNLWIIDPFINSTLLNTTLGTVGTGNSQSMFCVPADVNFDGYQEVTCSHKEGTTMFYSNATNQNAYLTGSGATFDPSTNLVLGQTLNIFITAFDFEGDQMQFIRRCSDSDNYTSVSATTSCVYNSVGVYNLTWGVKDVFHAEYNSFSTQIIVSQTGVTCNNNAICDSGETNTNCPVDCPSVVDTTITNSQAVGGIAIPTEIVSVTDTNKGLLPEIYYGILGFLSGSLLPMMILIFLIFTVLIIIVIGTIIKRIMMKVTG